MFVLAAPAPRYLSYLLTAITGKHVRINRERYYKLKSAVGGKRVVDESRLRQLLLPAILLLEKNVGEVRPLLLSSEIIEHGNFEMFLAYRPCDNKIACLRRDENGEWVEGIFDCVIWKPTGEKPTSIHSFLASLNELPPRKRNPQLGINNMTIPEIRAFVSALSNDSLVVLDKFIREEKEMRNPRKAQRAWLKTS